MTTVLVIGATGKTGRPLLDALTARGAQVRAATRKPGAANNGNGVEYVRFAWTEPENWDAALAGADALYVVGPYAEPDLLTPLRALLARARDVQRVVLLSVLGADQLPDSPMGQWEADVQATDKAWTIVRPNWFFQNFGEGAFTAPLRDKGTLELPAADAALGFVDTRDIAEVAAAALTEEGHAGQVYELTGPESLTHEQAVAVLGTAAGRDLRYVPIEPDVFEQRMRAAGAPDRSIAWQLGLFKLIRDGGNALVTDVVERITGHPARAIADYATEHATAWQLQ